MIRRKSRRHKKYSKNITFKGAILWLVWDFSGLRFIWEKIIPPDPYDPKTNKRKPATFFLWAVGIYITFFVITSQRYENRIDIIENRANSIFTQLGTPNYKKALGRIPRVQNMPCPIKPEIPHPATVFKSLFQNTTYTEIVELLKETVENWKDSLTGVDLSFAQLQRANLRGAQLDSANLWKANLQEAVLWEANLQGAELFGTNLQRAGLLGVDLQGADLLGVDLTHAKNLTISQLSKTKSLYNTKLDPVLLDSIKTMYPELRKEPE
jgi:hypothetical protein